MIICQLLYHDTNLLQFLDVCNHGNVVSIVAKVKVIIYALI